MRAFELARASAACFSFRLSATACEHATITLRVPPFPPYISQEYEHRLAVWLDNLRFAHEYNQRHTSHWLGMGPFADLTHEEWKQHALGYRPELKPFRLHEQRSFQYANVDLEALPKEVDWRKKNAVAEVKNQKLCGSCWAFSATGAIEGINAIVTGDLRSLSEQELVDCDTAQDHGCHGGLMDFAFEFVKENGGIDTEKDYPYTAEDGTCDISRKKRHVVTIDGYEDVPPNDEASLRRAVAHQPVSVAIEADQRAFQLYVGGVFDDDACGTALNHGVLVVGYGMEHNGTHEVPYWLVKNSWGPQWGDKGYIRLLRNVGSVQGQCGVAMQASYPIKKGPNPPEPPPAPPTPPPAPPGPQPVDCDGTVQCPPDSTCCCMRDFFGFCFTWACCPLPEATCCDDHEHCCPSDLPVCDTESGQCTAGEGLGADEEARSVPMVAKVPAQRKARDAWGPWRRYVPRVQGENPVAAV
jgi:KDEL-tailed cysteine endopeptidase